MNKHYTLFFLLLVFTRIHLGAQCSLTVDAGPDLHVCSPPSPVQLQGSIQGSYQNFSWTPTAGMSGASTLTPTVSPAVTTNYILTATGAGSGTNLIVNGDFEGGNSGFTSAYMYVSGIVYDEGLFTVDFNSSLVHPSWENCPDHTSGSGQYMIINGAPDPNTEIWCQTVAVTPGTTYEFSTWLNTIFPVSPAVLQFSINGTLLGSTFGAPAATCTWEQFSATWTSGAATSAQICIVNQNTEIFGNDFGLDDIFFGPVCTLRDTVRVHVVNVVAAAAPATVTLPCGAGSQVTLSGTGSSSGPNITYQWDTANGSIVSGANTLQPTVDAPGTYTLTVTHTAPDGTTCTKTASITVQPSAGGPVVSIAAPPQLGCGPAPITLNANSTPANVSYTWTASNGGNIVSGAGTKNPSVNAAGTYTVTVTTPQGCTAEATVDVAAAPNNTVAAATGGTVTCAQGQVTLSAAGSSSGAGYLYAWSTPNGTLAGPVNGPTATATAPGTYLLTVTHAGTGCSATATATVTANNTPPAVSIAPPGELTCTNPAVVLATTVTPAGALLAWTAPAGQPAPAGASPTVTGAGAYTLTATDPANGCSATATTTVTANVQAPAAVIQPPGQLSCAQPAITLSGNGSSTGSNIAYQWSAANGGQISSGHTGLMPTVTAAGTYTLTVTNTANGCTATADATVAADQQPPVVTVAPADTIDCTTASVALTANAAPTGVTYAWTTGNGGLIAAGAATPNAVAGAPGSYTLLVTNPSNGCTAEATVAVAANLATPSVTIDPPGQLTCSSPTQTLQAQVTPAGANHQLAWSTSNGTFAGATTGPTVTVSAPGQYVLTVTDPGSGCTATASVDVALQAGTPVAAIAAPAMLTCIDSMVVLDAGASSSGPPYSLQWTASNGGQILSGAATLQPVVGTPGTYSLLIANATNGCTAQSSVEVLQNTAAPPADAGPADTLTCLVTQLVLGTAPDSLLTYAWTAAAGGQIVVGANTAMPTVDAAGQYVVSVSDPANGCSAVDTVEIFEHVQPPALTVNAPPLLTCALPAVTLAANADAGGSPVSYSWSTADGVLAAGDSTATPLATAPGSYAVAVTNLANGCTAAASVTLAADVLAPALAIAPPPVLTCAVAEIALEGQAPAGSAVQWTTANGALGAGDTTLLPAVTGPGTYVLTATNPANGCSAADSVTVIQDVTPPSVEAGPNDTLDCTVSNIALAATGSGAGGLAYAWTTAGGNILAGASTPAPTVNAAGSYVVVVTDSANGCTASDSVLIVNDAGLPVANAGPGLSLTCVVSQTQLAGTGSTGPEFAYAWTAANGGNIVAGDTTLTPLIDAPGTYTLTVSNTASGCSSTAAVTISQDVELPAVDAGPNAALTCVADTVQLSATASAGSAPLAYTWQTFGGNIVGGGSSATPVADLPGTYILTVTNLVNGCTASDLTQVLADTDPPMVTMNMPVLTCAAPYTTLEAAIDLPPGSFTFSWSTADGNFSAGQNSLTPGADQSGTYTIFVENELNGCTASASVTVTENVDAPNAQIQPAPALNCLNAVIALDAGASTGQGALTYAWSGPALTGGTDTAQPTVYGPGTYTVTVTDNANSCTGTASVTVEADTTPPTAVVATPAPLNCLVDTVALQAAVSGAAGPYATTWSTGDGHIAGGAATLAPMVDQAGTYVLTVSDSTTGCTTSATVTVAQNVMPPDLQLGPGAVLNCQATVATLTALSDTPGPLAFAWSTTDGHILGDPAAMQVLADSAGTYAVTVTDAGNGCTATGTVEVTLVPTLAVSVAVIQPTCLQAVGTVTAEAVTGGTPPYLYSIDGGQSFVAGASFTGLVDTGTYALVVEDADGCTAMETVVLQAPPAPQIALPAVVTLDFGDSLRFEPALNVPHAAIASWQWTPGAGLSCTDCPAPWAQPFHTTGYTLLVTDHEGCTGQATVELRADRARDLYAPNVISPDGDGLNDYFNLFGKGVNRVRWLRIYDRWGNNVFSTESLEFNRDDKGWDGRFRGAAMNPAVFVWLAEVEYIDGETVTLKGDVTIVR